MKITIIIQFLFDGWTYVYCQMTNKIFYVEIVPDKEKFFNETDVYKKIPLLLSFDDENSNYIMKQVIEDC